MTFVLAVLVFPLLLTLLGLGLGLLVERAAGFPLPAILLAPLGFAGIVVVSQLTTWSGVSAPATPWVLLALALAGAALGGRSALARWRLRRTGWWWGGGAGLGAYLTVIAPVLLAGRVTFPGYLLDTTGAIQLMGAQRLVTEGHAFDVPGSGYGLALHGFFGNGYPSGSHSALGGVGRLVGVDLLWLYAPYLATLLGLAALVLAFLARRAGLPRPAAALAGWIAAVPALVYAYALQGSIKEIALLPTLLLLGALIVLARASAARWPRGLVPLAVVGAAGLGTIGLAFTPWLGLAALAVLAFGLPALGGDRRVLVRRLALAAVACGVLVALLAAPTVAPLGRSITQAGAVQSSNAAAAADPGNLLRPLLDAQALGVWLGGSHRGDPKYPRATYALIGAVLAGIVLGLGWLVRRRRWSLLAWIALSVLTWQLLEPRATTWTAAKLLVLLSPVAVLVAFIGALGRLGARRVEGLLLALAIAGGVLASDALLYHETALAPTGRFDELRQIGQRFAGTGPTLTPDFDEYTLYLLREMAPDGPGNARKVLPWTLADGTGVGYGHTYDVDALAPALVDQTRMIVVRRSPLKSRPPAAFALAWRGRWYDVWRRTSATTAAEHLGLGAGAQVATRPRCAAVRGLAERARRAGARTLTIAPRPAIALAGLGRAALSGSVVFTPVGGLPSLAFVGPGTVDARVRVPRDGAYRLWLEGGAGRALTATIDGRAAGSAHDQEGPEGNVMPLATLHLRAGVHRVRLVRRGGSLRPGDAAATFVQAIVLQPAGADAQPLRQVPVARWRSLCAMTLDWIERPPAT